MIKTGDAAEQTVMDRKIADALEKVAQVLRTLAWKKAVEQSLNPMQLQILIFLSNHSGQQAGVSQLSREFNISKASISDTVKLLENKGLVVKEYHASSPGRFAVRLSADGSRAAAQASLFDGILLAGISSINAADKEQLFGSLSKILLHLSDAGVITHQRMCQTCKHYRPEGTLHFCNLLQQYLSTAQLQIDCPEHFAGR